MTPSGPAGQSHMDRGFQRRHPGLVRGILLSSPGMPHERGWARPTTESDFPHGDTGHHHGGSYENSTRKQPPSRKEDAILNSA
jgi:hypothetical protein